MTANNLLLRDGAKIAPPLSSALPQDKNHEKMLE